MKKAHHKLASEEGDEEASEVGQRGRMTYDTRTTGRDSSSASTLEYTANIAAACDAVNAESKRSRTPSEIQRLEKRRESNRLSARRCRRRRRSEMDELTEELKRQSSIHESLALEQKVLKEELEKEIQGLQPGNRATAVMPPKLVPPSNFGLLLGQDQTLQSLLGSMRQPARPTAAPVPEMNGSSLLASLLNNQATGNNVPLSQESLAAAAVLLGVTSHGMNGYPMAAAPSAPAPSLYARAAPVDNNNFSARLARLEAAMNPPPPPNQMISTDLLSILFAGQAGATMPSYMEQNNQI